LEGHCQLGGSLRGVCRLYPLIKNIYDYKSIVYEKSSA
jgi:hypothetical protein